MRKTAWTSVKALVSIAFLVIAFRSVGQVSIYNLLWRAKPAFVAGAFVLLVSQYALASDRWRKVGDICGSPLAPWAAFSHTMVGTFFCQILPSTIGGDTVRAWLAARDSMNLKGAILSVLIDRLLGLIWLALIVLCCLPLSLQAISSPLGAGALIWIGVGNLCFLAGVIALANFSPSQFQRFRFMREILETSRLIQSAFALNKISFQISALSIAMNLFTVLSVWCIARSLGQPLSVLHALILVLPVMLISSIPISVAGWGIREEAMMHAFSYAGLPSDGGLVTSVLFGATMLLIGVPGGLIWMFGSEKIDDVA